MNVNVFARGAAVFLFLCLYAVQPALARSQSYEILPVADGSIEDVGARDGVADDVLDSEPLDLYFISTLLEARPAMEFNVEDINLRRVESAWLEVIPIGSGFSPEISIFPVEVFGYQGNGIIELADFNPGCYITLFDGRWLPLQEPLRLDVTEFLEGIDQLSWPIIGFKLRTNVDGALVFGSLEWGDPPVLIINLK